METHNGSGAPPCPRHKRGFVAEPTLYPTLLHNVANLIQALTAFDKTDPAGEESTHFVAAGELAIYNEEQASEPAADSDPTVGLVGWVVYEDAACWVFRPHVPSSVGSVPENPKEGER